MWSVQVFPGPAQTAQLKVVTAWKKQRRVLTAMLRSHRGPLPPKSRAGVESGPRLGGAHAEPELTFQQVHTTERNASGGDKHGLAPHHPAILNTL